MLLDWRDLRGRLVGVRPGHASRSKHTDDRDERMSDATSVITRLIKGFGRFWWTFSGDTPETVRGGPRDHWRDRATERERSLQRRRIVVLPVLAFSRSRRPSCERFVFRVERELGGRKFVRVIESAPIS